MIVKKNIPLILSLSIPILMIIFVAASIYLPGIFIKPKYDFIYITGDSDYRQEYTVKNNKLVYYPIRKPDYYTPSLKETKIFLYNVNHDKNREISFEEVAAQTTKNFFALFQGCNAKI